MFVDVDYIFCCVRGLSAFKMFLWSTAVVFLSPPRHYLLLGTPLLSGPKYKTTNKQKNPVPSVESILFSYVNGALKISKAQLINL